MSKEDIKQDELWDDELEEEKDDGEEGEITNEEELFEEEGEPNEEGKPKKDEIEQELKTKEQEEKEKEDPSVKIKAKVRKREEERIEQERRLREAEAAVYKDEDFEESQKLQFSNNKIEIEGEEKSLIQIAEEYPDVAALIKDAVGQVRKELTAPIMSAHEFIEDTRFWQQVETKHPNARSMSSNKEFMDWIEGDKDLQLLSRTGNPEDIVFILDTWATKTAPKIDEAKEAKKNILKKTKGSSGANRPEKN
jgi:hypothetical protein